MDCSYFYYANESSTYHPSNRTDKAWKREIRYMKDLYGQYAVDTFSLASIDGENKLITNEFEFVRGR